MLVIDDDPNSAEVAAAYLTGIGHEVAVAPDGFAGLKLILSSKPDLIVTDVWMPIGTGLSLAQRLRELGMNVPIIFMTAGRQEGLREAAKDLGVFAFFEKPYNSKEFLRAVACALEPDIARSLARRRESDCRLTSGTGTAEFALRQSSSSRSA